MNALLGAVKCSPKQLASIGASVGRVNVWEGSIRSGKTFSSILRWVIFIATAPRQGELVMIGKSRDSLYRNVLAPLMSSPEYAFLAPFVKYRNGAPTAFIFGREVHVFGANDSKSEGRIRGMTVCGSYVDELTMIDAGFFKQLLGRMSVPGAQCFATTNPDSPAHWLKVEYLDKLSELPDWRRFHFTLDDNPALEPAYVESIKREYTGLWYKRFILGLWVAAEGAIFNMWDPDVHVKPWEQTPPMRMLCSVGIDYGTTNATAALLLGLSKELVGNHYRSRLWLIDEWSYDSRQQDGITKPDVELSRMFRTWLAEPHFPGDHVTNALKPRFIVLDPSAASFRAQLHQDGQPTYQADNSVGKGIALMASLLAEQRLVVTDRCKGFIAEAPGYAWDPKKSEAGHDVPVKVADHRLDAARYAITTTEDMWRRQLDWPAELALT